MRIVDVLEAEASPSEAGRPEPLSPQVTALLLRLIAGWRPSAFTSSGGTLSWNDGEVVSSIATACEQDGHLIVELERPDFPVQRFLKGDFRNKPCSGEFHDGQKFAAQSAHVPTLGASTQVECFYWCTWRDEVMPQLWIAPLSFSAGRWLDFANIVLDVRIVKIGSNPDDRTTRTVLRLRAQYEYYLLLPGEDSGTAFLVFDTLTGDLPERTVLRREFLTLQFMLGQRLRLGPLAGLDHSGDAVAYAGGPYGTLHGKGIAATVTPKCPIADESVDPRIARATASHLAALFRMVVDADRAHPDLGLRAAMTFYLTSLGDYLEGSVLKLHVALEGLSFKLFDIAAQEAEVAATLEQSKALYLTVKHADWKAWCNQNAAKIRELSRPDVKDAVLNAVRRADAPGASQIVPTMLGHYKIPITPEIAAVLDARHTLVHTAHLPNQDDFDALVQHESIPRTLLIALIARVVGYAGPIRGYDGPCPPWWRSEEPPPGDKRLRCVLTVECSEEEWQSTKIVLEPSEARSEGPM